MLNCIPSKSLLTDTTFKVQFGLYHVPRVVQTWGGQKCDPRGLKGYKLFYHLKTLSPDSSVCVELTTRGLVEMLFEIIIAVHFQNMSLSIYNGMLDPLEL